VPLPPAPAPSAATATIANTNASSSEAEPPRAPAFWPCSVCGAHNAIALEICDTCGTPFAAVMRGTSRRVDPEAARMRSLMFPGAGHTMLGYPMDGFARGVLFGLSLALALLLIVATPRTGPSLLAIFLALGLAVGIYVLSLMEIPDLAARGHLVVQSKYLLWAGVVVMFLVVAAIALSVATSARR
jgi:hypothetical protein